MVSQTLGKVMLRATIADMDAKIAFDWRDALRAVTKTAVGLAKCDLSVFEGIADLCAAVQRDESLEARAWRLVRSALGIAIADLTWSTITARGLDLPESIDVVEALDEALLPVVVELDLKFFERPQNLKLLRNIQKPLAKWLQTIGLNEAEAAGTVGRLPSHFVLALHKVWAKHYTMYDQIRNAIETPFTKAAEQELDWLSYSSFLNRQLDEPLFGDTYSLRQVYQPPRAYYIEMPDVPRAKSTVRVQPTRQQPSEIRRVVELATTLNDWLKRADKKDALRVVCGGPGSGKSSFAKAWAADVASRGTVRLLLIPLQGFAPSGDLAKSIEGWAVNETQHFSQNPIDGKKSSLTLLLLDGLDELVMQGKQGRDAAEILLDRTRRLVTTRNSKQTNLLVVIGGRELLIQSLGSKLDPHEIFHVLPYEVYSGQQIKGKTTEWNAGPHIWRDPENLLKLNQRDSWWNAWATIKGLPVKGTPVEIMNNDQLKEIASQPLLNHLLALSHSRGNLQLDANVGINSIYEDLLRAVYERRWGSRKLPDHEQLSFEEFSRVFESIGLAAWHSGQARIVTAAAVEQAAAAERISEKLIAFERGAEHGAISLLTAFYFRVSGYLGDSRTYEFTHKSFAEYLTSRRIARQLELTCRQRHKNEQSVYDGWSSEAAITEWINLAGSAWLDRDLFRLLQGEIMTSGEPRAKAYCEMLKDLIRFCWSNGLPMHRVDVEPRTFREMCRRARNVESSLVAALIACAYSQRAIKERAVEELRILQRNVKSDKYIFYDSAIYSKNSYGPNWLGAIEYYAHGLAQSRIVNINSHLLFGRYAMPLQSFPHFGFQADSIGMRLFRAIGFDEKEFPGIFGLGMN